MNGDFWEGLVYWKHYAGTHHQMAEVYHRDVEFCNKFERGHKIKRKTMFLEDEQEPVRGRTKVKVGYAQVKAGHDSNRDNLKPLIKSTAASQKC